jgi:hypothetical protein
MKICEIQQTPASPEQQRIAALKRTKDQATKALDSERNRQQIAKAQSKLSQLKLPTPAT